MSATSPRARIPQWHPPDRDAILLPPKPAMTPSARVIERAMDREAGFEAADRFWDMHEVLFHRQKALGDDDLRGYAAQLRLDVAAFDRDRAGVAVLARIRRDVDSGLATSQVLGTPTLFVNEVVHRRGYDPVPWPAPARPARLVHG